MRRFSTSVVWLILICAIVSAVGILLWIHAVRQRSILGRVYRIGAEESPPYMSLAPDGSPSGFVFEVLQEAAKRRGIQLKWVPLVVPHGLDTSISDGVVDMWGWAAFTPERQAKFHLTAGWLKVPLSLVSLTGSKIMRPMDMAGRTVTSIIPSRLASRSSSFRDLGQYR